MDRLVSSEKIVRWKIGNFSRNVTEQEQIHNSAPLFLFLDQNEISM